MSAFFFLSKKVILALPFPFTHLPLGLFTTHLDIISIEFMIIKVDLRDVEFQSLEGSKLLDKLEAPLQECDVVCTNGMKWWELSESGGEGWSIDGKPNHEGSSEGLTVPGRTKLQILDSSEHLRCWTKTGVLDVPLKDGTRSRYILPLSS